jgi:hypothetical protein
MKWRKCPCPFSMDGLWVVLFLFEFSLLFPLFRLGIKKMKNRKVKKPDEAMFEGAGAIIASTPLPRRQWNRSNCSKCLARDGIFTFAHSPGFDVFIGSRCSVVRALWLPELELHLDATCSCCSLTRPHGWCWLPWLQPERECAFWKRSPSCKLLVTCTCNTHLWNFKVIKYGWWQILCVALFLLW